MFELVTALAGLPALSSKSIEKSIGVTCVSHPPNKYVTVQLFSSIHATTTAALPSTIAETFCTSSSVVNVIVAVFPTFANQPLYILSEAIVRVGAVGAVSSKMT